MTDQIPPVVWIDADPSGLVWTGLDCDDDLAILTALALHEKNLIQLAAGMSICGGNAPLKQTWKDAHILLQHAGAASRFKLHKGYGWRSMQLSRNWLRWLDWFFPDDDDSNDAVEAILQASREVDNNTFIILTLGPPTNVAKALEQDPTLAARVDHIYMMGGELTQQRLDLNFASDMAAARTVINSEIPTTLIPIQLCAQVVVDAEFVQTMERTYCRHNNSKQKAVCSLLPKVKMQVAIMPSLVNQAVKERFPPDKGWKPSPNLDRGFIPWDVVAVLAISHPELFDGWDYHIARFPGCDFPLEKPCDTTMTILNVSHVAFNTVPTSHTGLVRIPHHIRNESQLLHVMMQHMCQIPGHGNPPRIMLGFLAPVLTGFIVGVAVGLLGLRRRGSATQNSVAAHTITTGI